MRVVDRVQVKGKSGYISVYEVFEADPLPLRETKLSTKTAFEAALLLFYQGAFEEAAIEFQHCLKEEPQDQAARVYVERCWQHLG